MERAWELAQKIGGVLLLAEIFIFLIGSAHMGRPLRSVREFAASCDEVIGSITHEAGSAAHWVGAKGR